MEKGGVRLYLVGFMGSGKTTVGKVLARKLKVPFVDVDEEVVLREGLSIPEIFALKGEGYFRRLEREVLRELSEKLPAFVMATGGGLGADEEAMEYMKSNGTVVWLDVDFDAFLRRTRQDPNRPLLKRPVDELRRLFERRRAVYSKAHYRVKSARSPEQTARRVLELLGL
ncbi:MAG: shikimate kinase [Aquificae bacterium]|nr:shikimate kinase [Aquificota bacterium]